MHLEKMRIIGFRGIENLEFTFRRGLNVIIGGNNTGKTAVIDALRICLGLAYQRREVRVTSDDFFVDRFGTRTSQIEFHLTFMPQDKNEEGVFYEMLAARHDKSLELQMHVVFTREEKDGAEDRIRIKYWGGEQEGPRLPDELLEKLYFVHMGALRNSERDLLPGSGNRLGQLLQKLVSDRTKQKEYAETLNRVVNTDPGWTGIRSTAKDKINEHLRGTTIVGEAQEIDVDFVPLEYKKLVEQLKFLLPFVGRVHKDTLLTRLTEAGIQDAGWREYFENPDDSELRIKADRQNVVMRRESTNKTGNVIAALFRDAFTKFEVSQNGLGYNNLIFIATVLGDIIERKQGQPEAYVALLIEEPEAHLHPQLQDTLFGYFEKLKGRRIQIFITSHSPTITAKTQINALTVMQKTDRALSSTPLEVLPYEPDDPNRRKLQRFLDVTKCQLFFARGVILVEGISEALLLPILAKKVGDEYDLERNGVEVVNIDGVSFEPFGLLYNSSEPGKRLNVRCAILTDNDRGKGKGVEENEIPARAQQAEALRGGKLTVYLAERTFEHELFTANQALVKEVYQQMHPRTMIDDANRFVETIARNEDKAEFAQRLAEYLTSDGDRFSNLVVPEYLRNAIRWVIDG
jgi:putative ATP-dependent endonuclease of OLD family